MSNFTDHPRRILAAQLARFGDFLQTTPLLSALKTRHPEAELTLLVSKGQEALARANPDVDRVMAIDLADLRDAIRRKRFSMSGNILELRHKLDFLRNETYDLVLNLNMSRPAALLCDLPQSKRRMGPRPALNRNNLDTAPWADFIMNLMTRRRLIRFNLVDLLAGYAEGETGVVKGLTFPLTTEDRIQAAALTGPDSNGPLVGFQLGSRHPGRRWPPEYFAGLAEMLVEKDGARIVFLGTETEKHIGRAVLDRIDASNPCVARKVIDLMGETSIPVLGGVLSRLDLLVTTDTGTMHLAAAVDTPILALFIGPAFCHETGPYGEGHLILQTEVECSPCTEDRPPCVESDREDFFCRRLIDPEIAYAAAVRRMNRHPQIPTGPLQAKPGVQLLISKFDRFGVVYQPPAPRPLKRMDVLAAAYREAGRGVIRPGYTMEGRALREEFGAYLKPAGSERVGLETELRRLMVLLKSTTDRFSNTDEPDLSPFRNIHSGTIRRGEKVKAERIREDMTTVIQAAITYVQE